jgi:hypothetical protein
MFSSLFERLSETISGIWESVSGFFEVSEEPELFDEERISGGEDISPAEIYDVALAELEDARLDAIYNEAIEEEASVEEGIAALEEEPLFEEVEAPTLAREDWPSWITDAEVEVLREEFGVTSYDDMYDFEKDEYLPGWRGFEEADTPAGEIEDMEDFRKMVYEEFDLPEEFDLSDAEMMTLLMVAANQEVYQQAIESGLEPEELAEELDIEYRMTFYSIDDFLASAMWGFMLERPDLYEIYINPETGEVDVYEVY